MRTAAEQAQQRAAAARAAEQRALTAGEEARRAHADALSADEAARSCYTTAAAANSEIAADAARQQAQKHQKQCESAQLRALAASGAAAAAQARQLDAEAEASAAEEQCAAARAQLGLLREAAELVMGRGGEVDAIRQAEAEAAERDRDACELATTAVQLRAQAAEAERRALAHSRVRQSSEALAAAKYFQNLTACALAAQERASQAADEAAHATARWQRLKLDALAQQHVRTLLQKLPARTQGEELPSTHACGGTVEAPSADAAELATQLGRVRIQLRSARAAAQAVRVEQKQLEAAGGAVSRAVAAAREADANQVAADELQAREQRLERLLQRSEHEIQLAQAQGVHSRRCAQTSELTESILLEAAVTVVRLVREQRGAVALTLQRALQQEKVRSRSLLSSRQVPSVLQIAAHKQRCSTCSDHKFAGWRSVKANR